MSPGLLRVVTVMAVGRCAAAGPGISSSAEAIAHAQTGCSPRNLPLA
jgi:hypothetical protein